MDRYTDGFLTRTRRRNNPLPSSQHDLEGGFGRRQNDFMRGRPNRSRGLRKTYRQGTNRINWITPILLTLAVFFIAILFLYITLLLVVTTEIEESKTEKQALRTSIQNDDSIANVMASLLYTCEDGTEVEYHGLSMNFNLSPHDLVNDGYCDCPDGSDEFETSACSYLHVNKRLFSCGDKTSIFLSRVGDGIFDCSDGSDER